MVPQSSLAFYLKQLTKENNLAAVIVIINGTTISLVRQNNNAIAPIDQAYIKLCCCCCCCCMDSHLHGQLGVMVGINVYKVEELNTFLKQQLSLINPHFNILLPHFCKLFKG